MAEPKRDESNDPIDFDAIRTLRELKEAGMDEQLAETLVEVMMRWMRSNLASKQDIENLAIALDNLAATTKTDSDRLESNMATKEAVEKSEERVNAGISQLETRLTIRIVVIVGIFSTVIAVFG